MKNKIKTNINVQQLYCADITKADFIFTNQANEVLFEMKRTHGDHLNFDRSTLLLVIDQLNRKVSENKLCSLSKDEVFSACLVVGAFYGHCVIKKFGGSFELLPEIPLLNNNDWHIRTISPPLYLPVHRTIEKIIAGSAPPSLLLNNYDNLKQIHDEAIASFNEMIKKIKAEEKMKEFV